MGLIVVTSRTYLPDTYISAALLWLNHSGGRAIIFLISMSLFLRGYIANFLLYEWLIPIVFFMSRGFIEWFLHYYFWHENHLPIINKRINNPIAKMHELHHNSPNCIENLLFGGKSVCMVTFLLLSITFVITKNLGLSITICFSFLVILLCYEWCHLIAHSNIKPKSSFFKVIINNHRIHHFKDKTRCFGVSSTIADKFFGTN